MMFLPVSSGDEFYLKERLNKRLPQVGGGQPRDGDLRAGGFLAVLLGSAPVRRGGRIG